MSFLKQLRAEAIGSVTTIGNASMWGDIATGAWGVFALSIRLQILALFPLSVPLIAWLVVLDDKHRKAQAVEARKRHRAAYFQAYGVPYPE